MKCLIIAAGKGSRLGHIGDSKPLIPVLGIPLIERVIRTALKAGVGDFYVSIGYQADKVRAFLDQLAQRLKIHITLVVNEDWEKENGLSVLKAKGYLCGPFLLLMADHIIDESILVKLKNKKITDGEVLLAVDYYVEANKSADMNDATKVLVKKNRITDIGKNIKISNAYDTGIFVCSTAIFSALEKSLENGDSSLTGGIRVLARRGKVKVFDIGHSFWVDVDDDHALKRAEEGLFSTLKKKSDGPVSRYLNRPISRRITKHLLDTEISPNHISFFSFILSMAGALFFFLGGYVNLVIGATLAQASSIIDGCDGEIARLKFQATDFGGWFDAVLDRYADAFLLFGLTFYAYDANKSIVTIFIGFLAIIGSFMLSYTADKYDSLMRDHINHGRGFRLGRDVRVFLIFIGAIFNQAYLTLVVIAAVMNIETIRRVVICRDHG
jgi:CDP-L-myo-inositol myo-inositolphosphotransferase